MIVKSRILAIVVVGALVVAAIACGSSESEPGVVVEAPAEESEAPLEEIEEEPPTEEPESTEVPPTETPPVGTSRDAPAPPGSTVTVGDYTIVVTEAIYPADDIVAAANMFNPEPEEGEEYVMVYVVATCNAEDTCTLMPADFSLVGSRGVVYEAEWFVVDVADAFEGGEFFSGASREGYLFYIIAQGETDLVLIYEPLFSSEYIQAFMAVPETSE